MKFSAACWMLPPIALAVATISLGGCATGGSEPRGWACPPVAPYPAGLQAQAADELEALPPATAIETMLADYSVMRAQARACAEEVSDGP